MRSRAARWSLPIVLVALLGGCTSAPPPPPAVDQAAISAAVDSISTAFMGALTARDAAAVVAMYADESYLLAPNAPRADGKAAIHKAWADFIATPGMDLSITSNRKIVSEAGDMVIDLGSYVFQWQDASGKAMSDSGKYATTFKKVGGEWKIIVDMFNSDTPLPGA